ncbi:putative zinc protease-like protein y4wB [Geobacter sp. OR-1]|uniref:M16 family metallopeptidase n=1 Tax=Geobacter sp. OR-1 TaxID=1266765 RepID=UPI0005433962|nr:pitrilysin family protein [Geobacter sp. OR-1]GAM07864.1 putative zinc protease-like protein y4wB [Geobacter sp. OR-1]
MTRAACRFLGLILFVVALSGCTGALKQANPRTMTFPPLSFEIPKSQRMELANGMVVYLLEDHELPLVSITAYVNTGSIYDPPDKSGLASLTATVMRSGGSESMTPDEMDSELEFMASSVEAGISSDVGNVSMATLTKNLDRTLEIFAGVMTKPAFREERLNLAKKQTVEALRRQNDNPKAIADRELRKALYAGHPLGAYPTVDGIGTITRDDLAKFHRRFFSPNRTILAVAGDVKADELKARLEKLFAGWNNTAEPLPKIPLPSEEVKPQVLLAHKDVNQSAIRIGHLGIDKDSPDLYAIRVMDYILGGGFTSRLTQEIRSNQGLAYNVESHFDVGRRFVGTFVAQTETKSESTAKAITLMTGIIAGITKEPVSDQELDLAKNSIINAFIFGFAKPEAVVNQQARLEYYGYPKGYLENYRDNIAKVTRDDILQAARKHLYPDKMVISVVGNDNAFDKPLSTFGRVTDIKLENNGKSDKMKGGSAQK